MRRYWQATLSPRDIKILNLIYDGQTNKQIAETMGFKCHTHLKGYYLHRVWRILNIKGGKGRPQPRNQLFAKIKRAANEEIVGIIRPNGEVDIGVMPIKTNSLPIGQFNRLKTV
jgi:FixJ family two-component response regulator